MFSPDKKAKSPLNKRKKSAGTVGGVQKKAPSTSKNQFFNKSYMASINRSPIRGSKTPNKTGMNSSYVSRMSLGGSYNAKGFGFRSQYGGMGLKNNLLK